MKSRAAVLAEQNRLLSLLPVVRAHLQHIPVITNIGIGAKEVGGRMTDDFAFRVYVGTKLPAGDVPAQWQIPARVEGVPTDVLPTSSTQVLVDDRKLRPLRGGTQVKNEFVQDDSRTLAGTIGCLVKFIDTLEVMALTCEHVTLAGQAALGVSMGQPKYVTSCCCCTYNMIGKAFRAVKNAQLDCAVIKLDDDIANEVEAVDGVNLVEGLGTLTGAAQAVCFETIRKRGRTTGLTTGRVKEVLFEGSQILIEPTGPAPPPGETLRFADLGDSGSVLVNNTNQVVGLLWATDVATRTMGVANHIGLVMRELQIMIAGTADAGLGLPAANCP
jgi:hypothetical protein